MQQPVPSLLPIRFGEFLRDRNLITEEQWLAALAAHWSARRIGDRKRFGWTIVEQGFLPVDRVELEAARFHSLEVVEVESLDFGDDDVAA
jgi:hypothetical protein